MCESCVRRQYRRATMSASVSAKSPAGLKARRAFRAKQEQRGLLAHSRIEGVPQAITEEVERKHGQGQSHGRHEDHVRVGAQPLETLR